MSVCGRCDGDGFAHGSDRPFEYSGPGSFPGPCPVCKGTGREDEKEAEDKLVMACPECGRPVLHNCFHEGEELRSVEMPVSKAIELSDHYIEYLSGKIGDAKEGRQQLLASMMTWDD